MKREEGRIDEVWGGGKISQVVFGGVGKGLGPPDPLISILISP
jgi:hypothetical protein